MMELRFLAPVVLLLIKGLLGLNAIRLPFNYFRDSLGSHPPTFF